MIMELYKTDFYKCKNLLHQQGQLEVKAVVEGVNPGRIFVDNLTSPNAGLVWLGNNDGFIFIGNEENEQFNEQIDHFIETVIQPEALKVGLHWFEAIGNHPNWNTTIEKIFQHRKLGSWNQKVYMLEKHDYRDENEPSIKQEYSIKKLNKAIFESPIENIDFLHAKISEFWSSPESFFQKGIGYCAVHNEKIVSVCLSGFVVGNVHCIDIETLEEHQGNKLAQKVAHHFVQDCLKHGMIPYWDCMESNKPSIAVAENIGFTNTFNYVGYEFPFV